MRHIIESQQFDRTLLAQLFKEATKLEVSTDIPLRGKIMASLFYEPSTRTRFSFESAMHRLGGNVVTTENAKEFSSAAKGETIEDSIRVLNYYADVIVLRHGEIGMADRAASVANIPVINAGDGPGQHPTQALLDLYTIEREKKEIDGTHITMVGDLLHGRTVRSLCYLLGKYNGIHITFVSLPHLRIAKDIKAYLHKHNISFTEEDRMDTVIQHTDVIYQTRIQKERFTSIEEYEKSAGNYILNLELVEQMKSDAIVMHPLPRVDEIATEVDASPKAVYFKQAGYGVLVRMALLKYVLQK